MKGLKINKFGKTYWNEAKTRKFVEWGQIILDKNHVICLNYFITSRNTAKP